MVKRADPGLKRLTEFGSELHPLLLVHVVQDGVFGFLPHLRLSPPKQSNRSSVTLQRRLLSPQLEFKASAQRIVCSPLAAADEGPADGQDEDHEHEAGEDDVQHPPL